MCHFFASQSPESYAFETRSIRLNGQSTSLRLEKIFWNVLEAIAAREGFTVPKFVSTLHSEILIMRGEAPISPPTCAASVWWRLKTACRSQARHPVRKRPEPNFAP